VAQVNNAQKNTKKTSDEFGISAKLWANELSQGLAQAIVNAQDLGDALRNIAKSIAGSVLQKLIGKLIGGLFADGAAFQGGRVIPFAKGGIVTKPTIFPMARGMGLMGEAGPEAVMPLTRTAGGELGVKAEGNGGGGTHITMNINAVDSRSFVEMMRSNRASVESIVVENIMKNGAVRSAIRGLA
jgi:phage-related minor tail protein